MMEVNYKVTGGDRKRLVEAISEITGETFDYLRLPINAYTIGEFTVDRIGTLSCERDSNGEKVRSLAEKLAERGFIAESGDGWETQEEETEEAESSSETADETDEAVETPDATAESVSDAVPEERPEEALPEQEEQTQLADSSGYPEVDGEATESPVEEPLEQEEQTQFAAMEDDETTESPDSGSEEENAEAITTDVADEVPLDATAHTEEDVTPALEQPDQVKDAEAEEKDALVAENVDAGMEEDTVKEEPEAEATTVTIEVPQEGFTFTAIENLQRLVDSKETLIKQALGVDSLPIALKNDRISFAWFQGKLDAEHLTAYTLFIEKLCQRAKEATRIYGVENPTDNPRFSFRTFLVRLGMNGAAYGNARRILMERLPGSSAWRYGGRADNGLSDTVREQILELKNGSGVNLFDDSAVQNAASRSGFRELALYLENHRGKPRTEYVGFLLSEAEQE